MMSRFPLTHEFGFASLFSKSTWKEALLNLPFVRETQGNLRFLRSPSFSRSPVVAVGSRAGLNMSLHRLNRLRFECLPWVCGTLARKSQKAVRLHLRSLSRRSAPKILFLFAVASQSSAQLAIQGLAELPRRSARPRRTDGAKAASRR